ncbi:Crp/Fnr family transcriptional regulator [Propionibacteriaceae bacterium Y1923]|uniref:Crp/Fnr family transcriptional regulator n=1 Tax=Aestuariimicrobium sp. Y1814 TaxID=3418742 RepID=UPI003C1E4075
MPDDADTCVTLVPIFATLDAEAQLEVAGFARPRRIRKGATLYRQGEHVAQLFVVHQGEAKLTHLRADGHEQVLRTVGPGEVVGEHAFLTGARPDHTVVALEPVTACVFDHRDLGRLTATHPRIAVELLRALSQRLVDAEQRLTTLAGTDVPARLADYLLSLPGRPAEGGIAVVLPMTKREVASYLGTTPESFSRALARLEKDGAIRVSGSEILLTDPDALDARTSAGASRSGGS